MTDSASSVRKIILDEHTQIKNMIGVIENLLLTKQDSKTKNAVEEFTQYFLRHLATEEKILRPVLATIDAWGAVRAEKLSKEHVEQSNDLKRISALVREKTLVEYGTELTSVLANIKLDIEIEEKDFLSSDLLRDDVVTAGSCS